VDPPWTSVEVLKQDRDFGRFRTRMIGTHNLVNALAVMAVADHLGISAAAAGEALESFEGSSAAKRSGVNAGHRRDGRLRPPPHGRARDHCRREVRLPRPASHCRLRAADQLQHAQSVPAGLSQAFEGADVICIRRPSMLEKIPRGALLIGGPGGGAPAAGQDRRFFPDTDGIIDFVVRTGRSGDVVLIMSNGGFDNIHERLLESL